MLADGVEKLLAISTAHCPNSEPTFGDLRSISHEYGWILFICQGAVEIPDWLDPLYQYCIRTGISLIDFDCDAVKLPQFKKYSW